MCLHSGAQTWPLSDIGVEVNGVSLANGLAGGLNSAQFYPIDFNWDGIQDLMVFDRDGNKTLMFEGVPDGTCIEYEYRDRWVSYFPYMEEFAIPRDFTGDGVPDLFTYSLEGTSGMQLYRGIPFSDHIEFELVVLDQNYKNVVAFEIGGNLSNLPVSRIDLPAIYDLDGDGDLDILTFPPSGGELSFFKNMQVERNLPYDRIIYILEDDCWGGFYESDFSEEIFLSPTMGECASPLGGADTRHNGSTTLVWDPNKDGLLDVLIGDFTSNNLVYLQNGGTTQNAWMTGQDFKFPMYDQSVDMPTFLASFYVDVTCDGRNDLLVAPNIRNASYKTDNVLFYENIGLNKDSFEFRSDQFLSETMIDLGKKSAPAIVDLNADGWLDLVVGQEVEDENPNAAETALVTFLHNGDADAPAYIRDDIDYLNLSVYANGSFAFAPTFADMDADGDMDLIVGDGEGYLFYGENVAGPGAPVDIPSVIYGWKDIDAGQYAAPAVADLNGDQLPDLIIGEKNPNNDVDNNMICGNINYYQNTGTPTEPHFGNNSEVAPNTNCLGRINTKYINNLNGFAAPVFYDAGDSLLMFVGANSGTIARHVVRNVGEVFPAIDTFYGQIDEGYYSMPSVADIDNDGLLEMVVGNQRGGITIFDTPVQTDGSLSTVRNATDELSVHIYPNPLTHGQSLRIESVAGEYQLAIYSIDGRLMKKLELSGESEIGTEDLTGGVHIVVINSGDSYLTKKILVIK